MKKYCMLLIMVVFGLAGWQRPASPEPLSQRADSNLGPLPVGPGRSAKALAFPVLDSKWSTLDSSGTTSDDLDASRALWPDLVTEPSCKVDEEAVRNLEPYRERPRLFVYGLPTEGEVFRACSHDAPTSARAPPRATLAS